MLYQSLGLRQSKQQWVAPVAGVEDGRHDSLQRGLGPGRGSKLYHFPQFSSPSFVNSIQHYDVALIEAGIISKGDHFPKAHNDRYHSLPPSVPHYFALAVSVSHATLKNRLSSCGHQAIRPAAESVDYTCALFLVPATAPKESNKLNLPEPFPPEPKEGQ